MLFATITIVGIQLFQPYAFLRLTMMELLIETISILYSSFSELVCAVIINLLSYCASSKEEYRDGMCLFAE